MAESTEQTILAAAKKVFTNRGYAGSRMQEIADEAKINKAMLHYYYRSKEKLFEVIFEEAIDALLPKISSAFEGEGTVMERIEKIVHAYISIILAHPHLPMFVLHELSQNRFKYIEMIKSKAFLNTHILAFFQQIQEEQEAGLIKKIPPEQLILNVMSMCVFPFIAKPVFCNLIEIPEPVFYEMMKQRAAIVTDFIRSALRP